MSEKRLVRLTPEGPNGEGVPAAGQAALGEVIAGDCMQSMWVGLQEDFGTGTFMSGVWKCTPGTMKLTGYPFTEMAKIITGRIEITDEQGNKQVFGPGEAFTLNQGFKGTWHMPEPVHKHFALFLPNAQ
jgi:uncharacterized cupin superfamily protein